MPYDQQLAILNDLIDPIEDDLIAWRRHIHQNPETAWNEHDTTDFVAELITSFGLTPVRHDPTGLYVDIGPDHTDDDGTDAESAAGGWLPPVPAGRVGLRADLDALPLHEKTDLPYVSQRPGAMHACGHDIHTTALLGAVRALHQLHQCGQLTRGVRAIFQPAEELQPSGAKAMTEAGVLDGVGQIYCLHCDPKLDVGQVGTRIGAITAASDAITITLQSTGGHTSRPHEAGDVIYGLGMVATSLPALIDRRIDPRSAINLTWGQIQAGTTPNAMPSVGRLRGTLRSLDKDAWKRAGELIEPAVRGLVEPMGLSADIDIIHGIPPVINDDRSTRAIDLAVRGAIAKDGVVLTERSMGGEDFAWYLNEIPGAMARLGTRAAGGTNYDLHRDDIIFDEASIAIGAKVLAAVAVTATSP